MSKTTNERTLYLVVLEAEADAAAKDAVKNAILSLKGVKSVTEVKAEV